MLDVILGFIPLALAAIAPVMIMAVVLMLGSKGGLVKSLTFILGRIVAYAAWGLLFLGLTGRLAESTGEGETSPASLAIKALLGGLLLILALKIYLGEDDPDAPPPKWMSALDKATPVALFGIALLLSVVQLRFVLLMLAGATSVAEAQLPTGQTIVALLVLILTVIWAQLLPIIVYVIMGKRAQAMLESMNTWLARNQRMVNVVVLGLFGLILLWEGLSGLL
jgi:hypothetical protein